MGDKNGEDKTRMFGVMADKPLSQAVGRGERDSGSKADECHIDPQDKNYLRSSDWGFDLDCKLSKLDALINASVCLNEEAYGLCEDKSLKRRIDHVGFLIRECERIIDSLVSETVEGTP